MNNVSMTAPESTGGQFQTREKRSDIAIVPHGLQPVVCFGVVDMGTTTNNFGNLSHRIKFLFEFPFHRQFIYVDDTEQKPSVLSDEYNWTMYKDKTNKKTQLLNFVESAFGLIPEDQYKTFDFTQFLNKMFMANIVHSVGKNGKTYANIQMLSPVNQAFIPAGQQMTRTNELQFFSITGHGFESTAFAGLYFHDRKALKTSDEGIAWAQSGRKFWKFDENKNPVIDDAAVAVPNTATNHYNAAVQQQAQPQAGMQQPGAITHVQQLAVAPQQSHAAPAPTGPRFIYTGQAPIEAMRANGWTDEMMVQYGHGKFEAAAPAAPVAPQAPAAPIAPQAVAQPQAPAVPAYQQPAQQLPTAQPVAQPVNNAAQQFAVGAAQAQPQQVAPSAPQAVAQAQQQPAVAPHNVHAAAPTIFDMTNASQMSFDEKEHDDLPF